MSEHDHARRLLRKAQEDLDALKGMLQVTGSSATPFSDDIFGFHAQQAVEKALKAWLAFKGVKYKHTHDLMSLIDSLHDAGEDVSILYDLVDLNPFAVQYRYETVDEEEEPIDRPELFATV